MNYEEGTILVKQLFFLHKDVDISLPLIKGKSLLKYGPIILEVPGYKAEGDYKVLYKNVSGSYKAYSHKDIVKFIHDKTSIKNANRLIELLECIFLEGLNCTHASDNSKFKHLIYWLTLQEDLNYPIKNGNQGRKLPFQRYFEGILAKLGHYGIKFIEERTNNKGKGIPPLLTIPKGIKKPIFYDLSTTNVF